MQNKPNKTTLVLCLILTGTSMCACSESNSKEVSTEKSSPAITSNPVKPKSSLQQNEQIMQPFGDFKWGDDFSTVVSKICGLGSIETINFWGKTLSAKDICQGQHYDFPYIFKVGSDDKEYSAYSLAGTVSKADLFDGVKLAEFTHADITAVQPIIIQGIYYKADFTLDVSGGSQGAYLRLKDKSLVVSSQDGTVVAPASLISVTLTPLDYAKSQISANDTYSFLLNAYGSYKNMKAEPNSHKSLSYNYNGIKFDYLSGNTITYDGSQYIGALDSKRNEVFQQAEIKKSQKNDTSLISSDGSAHQLFPNSSGH